MYIYIYIYMYIYVYIYSMLAFCLNIVSHRFRYCYGFLLFKEERSTFLSVGCIQMIH